MSLKQTLVYAIARLKGECAFQKCINPLKYLCKDCVFGGYCSVECQQQDWPLNHQYVCIGGKGKGEEEDPLKEGGEGKKEYENVFEIDMLANFSKDIFNLLLEYLDLSSITNLQIALKGAKGVMARQLKAVVDQMSKKFIFVIHLNNLKGARTTSKNIYIKLVRTWTQEQLAGIRYLKLYGFQSRKRYVFNIKGHFPNLEKLEIINGIRSIDPRYFQDNTTLTQLILMEQNVNVGVKIPCPTNLDLFTSNYAYFDPLKPNEVLKIWEIPNFSQIPPQKVNLLIKDMILSMSKFPRLSAVLFGPNASFQIDFEKDMFGDAPIKILKLPTSFNGNIEERGLPSTLEQLYFGYYFEKSLAFPILPRSLKILSLGVTFSRQFLPNDLPPGLTHLLFNVDSGYNEKLNRENLPSSLQFLGLGKSYNLKFRLGELPPHLEYLTFGQEYNHSIGKIVGVKVLPDSIKSIEFVGNSKFDKRIRPGSMPNKLMEIKFGNDFNNDGFPLEPGWLEDDVERIVFSKESKFNQDIESRTMPRDLKYIEFGENFEFYKKRPSMAKKKLKFYKIVKSFPTNIEVINLKNMNSLDKIDYKVFPPSLKTLYLPLAIDSRKFDIGEFPENTEVYGKVIISQKYKYISQLPFASAMITENGDLYAIGDNYSYALGFTQDKEFINYELMFNMPVKNISLGPAAHGAFVTETGDLYTFGQADKGGELGDGNQEIGHFVALPQKIMIGGDADLRIESAYCIEGGTFAITKNGKLFVTGKNNENMLGSYKEVVYEFTQVKYFTKEKLGLVKKIEINEYLDTVVLTLNGDVFGFGLFFENYFGEREMDEDPIKVNLPMKAIDVSISKTFLAVVLENGKIFAIGQGQWLNNDKIEEMGGFVRDENLLHPQSIAPIIENLTEIDIYGKRFKKVKASQYNLIALSEDGELYGTGGNYKRVFGIKSTEIEEFEYIYRPQNPVKIIDNPIEMFHINEGSAAAITTTNDLYIWGDVPYLRKDKQIIPPTLYGTEQYKRIK